MLTESNLTTVQRAALALELLPRLEAKALKRRANKPGAKTRRATYNRRSASRAARIYGIGTTSVEIAKQIALRDPTMIERMRRGEFRSLAAAADAIDYRGRRRSAHPEGPTYYGKGDKFEEVVEPLLRYLTGWKNREYAFRHVPPREAQRRIGKLTTAIDGLQRCVVDLETRNTKASLNADRRNT